MPKVMLWKLALAVIGILAIMWAAGFDFQGAKDSITGTAQSSAESLTGSGTGGDWGA
jgi:hypothetical protein